MNNNDYLEKLLGEQYNMKNYFVDTYTEPQPQVNVIETSTPIVSEVDSNKTEESTETQNQTIEPEEKNEKQSSISYQEDETATNVRAESNSESTDSYQVNNTEEASQGVYVKTKIKGNEQNSEEQISEDLGLENQGNDLNEETQRQFRAVQVSTGADSMYPTIYQAIEPIVELSLANTNRAELSEDDIDNMTTRIYNAVAPSTIPTSTSASDTIPVSGRPHNNLLYDLIKILILNKLAPMPPRPPHHNHRPPMPPPRPPMHRPNSMRVSNNINYQDVPYPEDMV